MFVSSWSCHVSQMVSQVLNTSKWFFVRSIENCFWISKFSGAPASRKEFLTIARQPQVDFSVREAALAVGMSPARHMVEADLTWFEGMGNRVTNVLSTFHVNCTSGQICLVLVGLRDLQWWDLSWSSYVILLACTWYIMSPVPHPEAKRTESCRMNLEKCMRRVPSLPRWDLFWQERQEPTFRNKLRELGP